MNILVVHNHYRIRGGEDTVFESESAMLEAAGHNVFRYERDNSDIHEHGIFSKIGLMLTTIWSRRTIHEVSNIITKNHIDIVHCHNIFPLISPSIYWTCARLGVPIVQTLHNYRTVCLNGYLFDEHRCEICEKCLGKTPLPGVRHRCYRSSLGGSLTAALSIMIHRALGTYRKKVSCYIALTNFGRDKMIKAGFPAEKIVVKPNVCAISISTYGEAPRTTAKSAYFLYAGRLSREKGPDIMIRAFSKIADNGTRLIIAGDGPMRKELETLAKGVQGIEFIGRVEQPQLRNLMNEAVALIVPSILYETFCLAAYEACSIGTPVIISDCTCVTSELVASNSGISFKSGDPDSLASAMTKLLSSSTNLLPKLNPLCAPPANLSELERIYNSLCERF